MGLTRIRAEQISDIDYKQAVRVITTANITLSGGAPSVVDGVTLSANDRVLVAGQSTASQNGLYDVVTVGTGSSGTWARTSDANATGEINAGMIVMVTEGTTYADTSWKLITNDPITIGTTGLTFAQNTGNSFGVINANGTPVVANGAAGTTIFNSGNNLVLTGNAGLDTITFAVSDAPTFSGNVAVANLSTAGNIQGSYILGNGSQLTGINASSNTIFNGTSNVNIATANGAVTISADGLPNLAVFGEGTLQLQGAVANPKNFNGNISVAGNVNAMLIGPINLGPGDQIVLPDTSTLYIFGG